MNSENTVGGKVLTTTHLLSVRKMCWLCSQCMKFTQTLTWYCFLQGVKTVFDEDII